MNLFDSSPIKEDAMRTCACQGKCCNGIIQKTDPRKIVDGKAYKIVCGFKEERKNAQRDTSKGRPNKDVGN